MKMYNQDILTIKDIIKNSFNVEKIILFGSYAKGNNTENSDIDICVITNDKNRKLDISRQIRRSIYPYISKSVDLLIYNSAEFYDRAENLKSIEREIMNKGINLYEQR
jgi:uncharacterized protein